jgi:replicative DNA helicase
VPTAIDHARLVLGAIIPDRRDLLDAALLRLQPEHFPDQTLSAIFRMLDQYHTVTGAVLTPTAVDDLLRRYGADAGRVALYRETMDFLAGQSVEDATFRWSVDQLRELAADRETNKALTEGMQILLRGAEDHRGNEIRGHTDARAHVLSRFADIDRGLNMQDAPEGDMRVEADDMLADYTAREAARTGARGMGIRFGIPPLDAKLSGLQPGEMCLIVGWTGDGKTSLCVQLAWHACVVQSRNVVILTTETIRQQVRRRLIARHSCLEHFQINGGLNSRDLRNGTLSAPLRTKLGEVLTDFTANPGYGHCYIVQVPRAATVSYCESKLARLRQNFPVDLVIMDYLALLRPDRKRNSYREELNDCLKEAKQLATTFADGTGVPFVSPWQVNRASREQANTPTGYTAASLSESSEAANSSDIIVGLLAPMDNEERVAPVRMQILKNRDGERASTIPLKVDYATSRFAEDEGAHQFSPMDAMLVG